MPEYILPFGICSCIYSLERDAYGLFELMLKTDDSPRDRRIIAYISINYLRSLFLFHGKRVNQVLLCSESLERVYYSVYNAQYGD